MTRISTRRGVLSTVQEGLWLAEIAASGTPTFTLPMALAWAGSADVAALTGALQVLVRHHEILRTTYHFAEDEPVQVIAEDAEVAVEFLDLTGAQDAPALAQRQALARAATPFDIEKDIPLRATLWRRPPAGDLVLLTTHHLAADGWSMSLLLSELAQVYEAHLHDREPGLPPPSAQYADFAVREQAFADGPEVRRSIAVRAAELRPFESDLPFTASTPGPVRGARRGRQDVFTVPAGLRTAIRGLAAVLRTTVFTLLLSAFQAVLTETTGKTRFLVGTPMANRPDTSTQTMLGCCANTVPLRCIVDPQWTFEELCRHTSAELLGALSLQHLPYRRLVAAGAPVTTVTCALHVLPNGPGPWHEARYVPTGTAKSDLSLLWEDNGTRLAGTLEHDIDRCPPAVVDQVREGLLSRLAEATGAGPR